jgi:hypothetical protein
MPSAGYLVFPGARGEASAVELGIRPWELGSRQAVLVVATGGNMAMWIRRVLAVAVFVSAVIHLEQWIIVFRHTAVVGPAMLANFAGGVVIAALLLFWHHWAPLALAALFGAATLGAFLTAVTVGLFGVHEHWTGWEIFTAAAVEIVAIIGGLAALPAERRRSPAVSRKG